MGSGHGAGAWLALAPVHKEVDAHDHGDDERYAHPKVEGKQGL